MKFCIRFLFLVNVLFSFQLQAQIEGAWYADLNVQGMEIPLVFHFEVGENNQWTGKMDSPKQKAFGIPIDEITFNNDSLNLKVNAIGVKYNGKKTENKIQGKFYQGAFSTTLNLFREKIEQKEKQINRPQEPKAPFSYHEEEIKFLNEKDSIWLAGTLTYPKDKNDFPMVVLISGSGAQDRNSEILGHKPFLVAADYLTNNGIGVLRFDERGTAESEGDFSNATSLDLMEDVYAAVQFLKQDERFSTHKIGLYGHSEGGMIAPLLADVYTKAVDFLVLLAPPTVPIPELMLKQQELVSLTSGVGVDEIEINAKINKGAYAIIVAHDSQKNTELKEKLLAYFQKVTKEYPEIGKSMGLSNSNYIATMVNAYTNPWMVYFLKSRPEDHLTQLKLPILALFAENDLQVSAEQNAAKMESIILKKNPNNEVVVFPKMNHLFQVSETGDPSEYAQIEQTISKEVLKKIEAWINSLE